jgi:penicillin-binding protein 1C
MKSSLQANPRRSLPARVTVPAGLALVAGLLVGIVSVWGLRQAGRADESRLQPERASTVYTDRTGAPLRVILGADDQWQIPVPLTRLSPWLVFGVPAVEDQRFWAHHGVDWLAVARAAHSNVTSGRIISGASTLSMQLARLAQPERRSLGAKARQALRALDLESRHSKEWILERYLNQAPYGGNLVGVEAAARAYFGKAAAELNLAEAALLIGLPQRPAAYRPDRYPRKALERRQRVLECLVNAGLITPERARATDALPLGVLPPSVGAPRPGLPHGEPLFCAVVSAASPPRGGTVLTTLDRHWQDIALTALRCQVQRLAGVDDGAAVIIDNATGAVRALVGTLDVRAPGTGWVNAACSRRSPGSALKPFIVAAALEAGLVLPETLVADEPLTLPGYRPENFDGRYRGMVTVREALSRSLNTPAVRLLQEVGPDYVHALLLRCGLRSLAARSAADPDLSLALGSGEVTLLELTGAYVALARGGDYRPPCFVEAAASTATGVRVLSPGSATLLVEMLASRPLPGAPRLPVAWKTGTSNGSRDAWCLALNRDITIGVWLGNKSGRPAEGLVGVSAAAPVVADILARLYAGTTPAPLPVPTGTEPVDVCRVSGLPAGPACLHSRESLRVTGFPTRLCARCRPSAALAGSAPDRDPQEATEPPRILLPRPGSYLAAGGSLRLAFSAAREEPLLWFVDGVFLGQFAGRDAVELSRGVHRVEGIRPAARTADRITVRID